MSVLRFPGALSRALLVALPALVALGVASAYYFAITGTFWAVTGEFTRWGGHIISWFGYTRRSGAISS